MGAGPGGLYGAIAIKRHDPSHEVRVLERRAPSATSGWGIVYWDDLLAGVRSTDPETARRIRAGSVAWSGQRVRVAGSAPVHLGGTGFGMARSRLLDVLTRRARELGVRVDFGVEVGSLDEVAGGADLVVLADGARSRLRRSRATAFGTTEGAGRNRHLWLGSRARFADFTFAFEPTAAGWIWLHAYSFSAEHSTIIVECSEQTWRGLGFDTLDDASCRTELGGIFARHLAGAPLENNPDAPATWGAFPAISNARWHDGRVVLVGDAAHTTHFSIGSGTRLAFEDGGELARALADTADLPTALQRYADARQPAVARLQRDAARSARWFEAVEEHLRLPPVDFGYALRTRRTLRDPEDDVLRSGIGYRLHRLTQWRAGRRARRAVSAVRRSTSAGSALRLRSVRSPRGG